MAARNVTGHVYLVERKRGDKWYVRFRLADRSEKREATDARSGGDRARSSAGGLLH
jgi:hypothetical protein